jgi:hypothetical protein
MESVVGEREGGGVSLSSIARSEGLFLYKKVLEVIILPQSLGSGQAGRGSAPFIAASERIGLSTTTTKKLTAPDH